MNGVSSLSSSVFGILLNVIPSDVISIPRLFNLNEQRLFTLLPQGGEYLKSSSNNPKSVWVKSHSLDRVNLDVSRAHLEFVGYN
jgi:hypothetical protein